MTKHSYHVSFTFSIFFMLFTVNASATNILACDISHKTYRAPPSFKKIDLENTHISADQTQILKDGISRFTGNVIIEQHEIRLNADSADYDKPSENVTLKGNVHADTINLSVNATSAYLSLDNEDSLFNTVDFYLPETKLRGTADTIKFNNEKHSFLDNTLITSCARTNPDWSLTATTIEIDHDNEYGSADEAVLNFKGVPFFYIPYIEFPIGNKRRSGILIPEIGSSSSNGLELTVPWYWNISPNQDATLTPRYMHKIGLGIDTNYRYLTKSSTGSLDFAILPSDKITNTDRHFLHYQQLTDFNSNAALSININDVSDTDYNNDFNNIVTNNNLSYLDKEIAFNYNADFWQANILAHAIEPLNSSLTLANRPYRRLPQISFESEHPLNSSGLNAFIQSEVVSFEHKDPSRITGTRFMVTPGIQYLMTGPAWHLTPSFQINHTQYDTEDSLGNPVNTIDRTVPITSIDAGLYFERTTENNYLQTLEPRLYYLNVPYEDQSSLPIFDTNLYEFGINQLFRNNRFNGNDLVGDANQLSLSLSSKLYDTETGNELVNASIGQIYYFEDRKTTLPTKLVETNNTSDLIAEISSTINKWNFSASTQWDTKDKKSEKDTFSMQYRPAKNNIYNVSYRMRQNTSTGTTSLRQIDTSFIQPINNKMNFIGRWNYSLKDERDIAVLGGIAYDSCCWSMTLVAQRYLLNDQNQKYDSAIMLQLIFKEFGSVSGNRVKNTLKNSVPGYTEEY